MSFEEFLDANEDRDVLNNRIAMHFEYDCDDDYDDGY